MERREYESQALSRAECLALLPMAPFGRLVFTEGALPAIILVNFVLDPAGIVIRTREGGGVCRAVGSTIVAFQADDLHAQRRTGWSVSVVGRATVVREPIEVERLSALPLLLWIGGDRHSFVVVSVNIVTGLRIGGPEPTHPAAQEFTREPAVTSR